MKVSQFLHANQFVIDNENWLITFQSYDSQICDIDYNSKTIRIYENRDYSKTTLRHFYAFLSEYAFTIDRKTLLKIKDRKIDSYYNWYNIVFDENVKAFEKSLKEKGN
jgi:hypothetical protein